MSQSNFTVWVSPLSDWTRNNCLFYFRIARRFINAARDFDESELKPLTKLESIKREKFWSVTPTLTNHPLLICLCVQNTAELEESIRSGAHVVYINPECHGLIFQVVTLASSLSTYRKSAVLASAGTFFVWKLLPRCLKFLPEFVQRHISENVILGVGIVVSGYACIRHFWLSFRLGGRFSDYDVVKFKLPSIPNDTASISYSGVIESSATPLVSRQGSLALLSPDKDLKREPLVNNESNTLSTYATPITSPDGSMTLNFTVPLGPREDESPSEPTSVASSTLELRLSSPEQDSASLEESVLLGTSSIIEASNHVQAVSSPNPSEINGEQCVSNLGNRTLVRHFVLVRCDVSAFYNSRRTPKMSGTLWQRVKSLITGVISLPILSTSFWSYYMPAKYRRYRSFYRYGMYFFCFYVIQGSIKKIIF